MMAYSKMWFSDVLNWCPGGAGSEASQGRRDGLFIDLCNLKSLHICKQYTYCIIFNQRSFTVRIITTSSFASAWFHNNTQLPAVVLYFPPSSCRCFEALVSVVAYGLYTTAHGRTARGRHCSFEQFPQLGSPNILTPRLFRIAACILMIYANTLPLRNWLPSDTASVQPSSLLMSVRFLLTSPRGIKADIWALGYCPFGPNKFSLLTPRANVLYGTMDRKLWRNYLPRMKYYNPNLEVDVKRRGGVDKKGPSAVTVHFSMFFPWGITALISWKAYLFQDSC